MESPSSFPILDINIKSRRDLFKSFDLCPDGRTPPLRGLYLFLLLRDINMYGLFLRSTPPSRYDVCTLTPPVSGGEQGRSVGLLTGTELEERHLVVPGMSRQNDSRYLVGRWYREIPALGKILYIRHRNSFSHPANHFSPYHPETFTVGPIPLTSLPQICLCVEL